MGTRRGSFISPWTHSNNVRGSESSDSGLPATLRRQFADQLGEGRGPGTKYGQGEVLQGTLGGQDKVQEFENSDNDGFPQGCHFPHLETLVATMSGLGATRGFASSVNGPRSECGG
jgi:hypothetical protein